MTICHFRQLNNSRGLFLDKSGFHLLPTDSRVRLWRPPDERHSSSYAMGTVSYAGGSGICVLAAITRSSKSKLVILQQTVNKERDYLLPRGPLPSSEIHKGIGRCKTTTLHLIVAEGLRKKRDAFTALQLELWLSRSPDLNPIEYACSMLSRRISRPHTLRPWNLAPLPVATDLEKQFGK